MTTTSPSLLLRLQNEPTPEDWQRLIDLYEPLIRSWLQREPTTPSQEVDDLVQDILTTLVQELPRFERRREGSFRNWLRTVMINRIRLFWRKRVMENRIPSSGDYLDQLQDPHSDLTQQWNLEHDRHVAQRLLELVVKDFAPQTWMAFQKHVLEERSASEVAAELETTVNVVLLAKSRVLARLREESQDFLEK